MRTITTNGDKTTEAIATIQELNREAMRALLVVTDKAEARRVWALPGVAGSMFYPMTFAEFARGGDGDLSNVSHFVIADAAALLKRLACGREVVVVTAPK
jgi:hypothetical protein